MNQSISRSVNKYEATFYFSLQSGGVRFECGVGERVVWSLCVLRRHHRSYSYRWCRCPLDSLADRFPQTKLSTGTEVKLFVWNKERYRFERQWLVFHSSSSIFEKVLWNLPSDLSTEQSSTENIGFWRCPCSLTTLSGPALEHFSKLLFRKK